MRLEGTTRSLADRFCGPVIDTKIGRMSKPNSTDTKRRARGNVLICFILFMSSFNLTGHHFLISGQINHHTSLFTQMFFTHQGNLMIILYQPLWTVTHGTKNARPTRQIYSSCKIPVSSCALCICHMSRCDPMTWVTVQGVWY